MNVQKKMKTWRKKLLNLCVSRNHCWNILSTTEIDGHWLLSSEDWRVGYWVVFAHVWQHTNLTCSLSLSPSFICKPPSFVGVTYRTDEGLLPGTQMTQRQLHPRNPPQPRKAFMTGECVGEGNDFFLDCKLFFWFQAWIIPALKHLFLERKCGRLVMDLCRKLVLEQDMTTSGPVIAVAMYRKSKDAV